MISIGLLFNSSADRHLLAGFLQGAGYAVHSPAHAEFQADAFRHDSLIIVDEAAGRRHGPALIALKRQLSWVYLPVLVALGPRGRAAPWLEAGFDDVVRMPIPKIELIARLGTFIRLRSQSVAQYESFVENALVGIYRAAPDGRLLLANQALVRMLGQSSVDDCVGRTLVELGFAADPPRWALERKLEREGDVAGLESVWIRPDGSQIFVREYARVVRAGEAILYREGTLEDITAQKQAEAALANSEHRFRAMIERSADAVALMAPDGRLLYVGSSVSNVIGYQPDTLIGRNAFDLVHPDDRLPMTSRMTDLVQRPGGTVSAQFRMLASDGTWRWIDGSGTNLLLEEGVQAIVANFRDVTERKLAEAELRQQRDTYDLLLRSLSDLGTGVGLVTPQASFVYTNEAMGQIFGYTSADLQSLPSAWDLLHPADVEAMQNRFQRRVRGEAVPDHFEVRGMRRDGTPVSVEVSAKVLPEQPSGQVIIIARDITERKRAEAQLVYQAHLLENVNDAVVATDEQLRLTLWNAAAETLFGWPAADVLGRDAGEVLDTQFEGADRASMRRQIALAGSWRGRGSQRRRDGTRLQTEMATKVLRDEAGQITSYVSVLRDITARLDAERAQSHLAAIVASSDDAILSKALDGTILSWNAAAQRLYGYSEEEIVGQSVSRLVPPDRPYEVPNTLEKIAHGQRVDHFETWRVHKAGHLVNVSVSISPLRSTSGEIIGASSIARDISERKRIEAALAAKSEELAAMNQQLWQVAKLATMGELAASIAHELNNPLAIVSLRLEMLRNSLAPGDTRRTDVEIVEAELERMAVLVAELLQHSRRHPQISTVDLRTEITNALEFVSFHMRHRGIVVDQVFAPDLPFIQADRQLLRQAFLNVLTNASDAMPQGGRLFIEAAPQTLPNGEAGVFIEFRDTGVGIKPEVLARIWEPFFTTKGEGKGTGLGLPICRRIVQEHGGNIEMSSRVGEGTAVRLSLPVHANVSETHMERSE